MKLYLVWCEYDIGLNLTNTSFGGAKGVYISEEVAKTAIWKGIKGSGLADEFDYKNLTDAEKDGIFDIDEIETSKD